MIHQIRKFPHLGYLSSDVRRLRKAIESHIPDYCKEEQELVPGGDLRCGGNSWLRKAFEASKVQRVPREAEVRKVVHQLVNILDICALLNW